MHIKDYDIITDYFGEESLTPENGDTIMVSSRAICGKCDSIVTFAPLISDGECWHCLTCWGDSKNEPLTEGTHNRLLEVSETTRANYLIRNM